MAIAGKVSIVPRGEWKSTEVYTKLDLVTFNYNVYLALKESVGIEPTNEEYFMLLIENVVAGNLEDLQNQIDDIILGKISVGNSENSNNLNNQPPSYYATAQSVDDIVEGVTPVAKAEDSQKLNGLTAEEFVNNGNMLINTDFSNPVNSSGKTEWSGYHAQCVDKWYFESNHVSDIKATLVDDGIKIITNTGETSEYGDLYQEIQPLESGKIYTFSVSVDNTIYSCKITGGTGLSGGIVLVKGLVMYYLIRDGFDLVYIRKFNDFAGDGILNWIKLEPGHIATQYIPPNKEVEKLKCTGSVDKLGNETAEQWQEKLDEIQSTSIGRLSQIGWYRVAEFNGTNANMGSFDLSIKRAWNNELPEEHNIQYRNNREVHKFNTTNSISHWVQTITKIRVVNDNVTNKRFVDIYYNLNLGNVVLFDFTNIVNINADGDFIRTWKAITPTLTQETLDGVTVTATYDIPANASPVTDLDLKKSGLHDAILSNSSITDSFTIQDLLNRDGVTFFTNNTNDTDFPFKYGSGVMIPARDSRFKIIYYGAYGVYENVLSQPLRKGVADISDGSGIWKVTWQLPFVTTEDLTTALAGYLPNSGGKIYSGTTDAPFRVASEFARALTAYTVKGSPKGGLGFDEVGNAITMLEGKGYFNILHTGNKPSGSYTGNGSATARTINVGTYIGICNVCMIACDGNRIAFALPNFTLCFDASGNCIADVNCKFQDGKLVIATNNSIVNANGAQYGYQVL